MRILIATDAWAPQVNGVVVSLANTIACLRDWGHEVRVVEPGGFRTVPLPSYPEVPLAVLPGRRVARLVREFEPDAIHVSTEGPIGAAARRHCLREGLAFTTAYHTCFPEYVRARLGVPLAWTYAWLRRFHAPAAAVLVATDSIRALLEQRGFTNVAPWSRGVDLARFRPAAEPAMKLPRPVFTYVGRLAVEKDLPAFLGLDLPGTKLVVGDGPERERLARRFPDALFVGAKSGAELVAHYQHSDVFVFPSRTDTFGLVLVEAMACGTPVAALPVRGPIDVVTDNRAGILNEDLRQAALHALDLDRAEVRRFAERFSWERSTRQFCDALVPARPSARARPRPPADDPADATARSAAHG